MIKKMLTCHWSGRRLQRYLDADPSALLEPAEVARLEAHLAVCAKCAAAEREFGQIRSSLSRWSTATMPDENSVAHLRQLVDRLTGGETR